MRHLVVLLALGGCGDNLPLATTASPVPAITGTHQVIHWDEHGGSASVAPPLLDLYIEAELPGGDIRPATIADDGSFSIAGSPPEGAYWLRIVDGPSSREDVYVRTDQTAVDLSRDVVGNASTVAQRPETQVALQAGGIARWTDGDDGDLVLPDIAHSSSLQPFYATNTPVAGDTSLNISYAWFGQAVAADTDAYVVQVRPAHDDALGLDYNLPIKAFHATPLAIADGGSATIAGTFSDPPPLAVPVQWMRSAFAAQRSAMHPAGCDDSLQLESYGVHALPAAGAHGELDGTLFDGLDGTPEYAPRVVDAFPSLDETDLTGTIATMNPYPADWLFAKYSMTYSVACTSPTGRAPGNALVSIGLLTADVGGTATPLVGPVTSPQISGRDLLAPQGGVGHRPTISWHAPSLGRPTSYELRLFEVVRIGLGGGVSLHEDARMIVPASMTSIELPRGLLADDTLYTLEIRAVSRPDQDTARAPFRAGMPYGFADLLTSYFQP